MSDNTTNMTPAEAAALLQSLLSDPDTVALAGEAIKATARGIKGTRGRVKGKVYGCPTCGEPGHTKKTCHIARGPFGAPIPGMHPEFTSMTALRAQYLEALANGLVVPETFWSRDGSTFTLVSSEALAPVPVETPEASEPEAKPKRERKGRAKKAS